MLLSASSAYVSQSILQKVLWNSSCMREQCVPGTPSAVFKHLGMRLGESVIILPTKMAVRWIIEATLPYMVILAH